MRLPGDEEPVGSGLPVVYMVVGVSAFVLILLFAILKSNDKQSRGSTYLKEQQQQEEMAAEEEAPCRGSGFLGYVSGRGRNRGGYSR